MNLARALGSVGGLTLASRVLGLARDMLFAQFVGANFASDAFAVAWRMPNMFRALFAEGAFSAAFIPMFNRKVADKEGPGLSVGVVFVVVALLVLLPSLLLMTILLELFAWPATYLISLGFHGVSHDQFAYAVMLARLTFPYLMLISLASLLGGRADPPEHRADRRSGVLPHARAAQHDQIPGAVGYDRRGAAAGVARAGLLGQSC